MTNRQAVEWTALTGLALNCRINSKSKFDRKHYFYPDLPKGFQISQYDQPIAQKGQLAIGERGDQKIRINRVHLEEDAGKLIHPKGSDMSLVDFNRAGTPLMEVVTEPDIKSPAQAKEFLKLLKLTVVSLGVSDADMEKGQLRCDANISVQKGGQSTMIVEVKNLNSFRAVHDALSFEAKRLRDGFNRFRKIKTKETRGWLVARKETIEQRRKEEAADYRYFPEPDIPPLNFTKTEIDHLRSKLPKLPVERRQEYRKKLGLTDNIFWNIMKNVEKVEYFDRAVKAKADPLEAANWLINEDVPLNIKPKYFAEFTLLRKRDRLPNTLAKQILELVSKKNESPRTIIKSEKLEIKSGSQLEETIKKVVQKNGPAVKEYQNGKENALQYLVGQAMKETRGRADPQSIQRLLKKEIEDG